MKKLKIAAFIFVGLIIHQISTQAAVLIKSQETAISISEVYVPEGLNSKMDSYVVIAGIYPNGCYSWKRSDVVSLNLYSHIIRPIADVTQAYCIMVLVPFNEPVQLGRLSPGFHHLLFLSADGSYLQRTLEIEY